MVNQLHDVHTTARPRVLRWGLVLALVVFAALLLGGCAGSTKPKALTTSQFATLGAEMAGIEQMTPEARQQFGRDLTREARGSKDREVQGRALFLRGYAAETTETLAVADEAERDYSDAAALYQQAATSGSAYITQAQYRLGILGDAGLVGPTDKSAKLGKDSLIALRNAHGKYFLWLRDPHFAGAGGPAQVATEAAQLDPVTGPTLYSSELVGEDAATVAMRLLDDVYKNNTGLDGTYYRIVDAFVGAFKSISPTHGAVLALFFIALAIKLVTMPLTTKGQRGIRDMQRIQPMLQQLQEKYKDDREKLAKEQMELMKEHKVSPLGGCLPMLIQIPVFIVVWQAVSVYAYQFSNDSFLWIRSLAQPDLILLGLYAVSIIVSQYLTTPPSTDPQQKQMQMMMTYMMPVFLVFVLQTVASAFVLYWFFLNVFNSVHQYYLMRQFKKEDLAREAAGGTPPAPKKGKS